jgi:FAD:protein FMN transferase
MSATVEALIEQCESFACFGSRCTVIVADTNPADGAAAALRARRQLLGWHGQFSRFESDSELTRLNLNPAETVVVSPLMRRVVEAGVQAARASDGLVDPTLLPQLEQAGYRSHYDGPGVPMRAALAMAPARRPGRPAREADWRLVSTDRRTSSVTRPPGVQLELGGIAKGVFADEVAALLARHDAFVVDCGGDLRLGGGYAPVREVRVASPFEEDGVLHTFGLRSGAVATSGIGRRSWIDADGHVSHHLLDPRSGRPAFTGIVQVTALAPTTTEAETLSKAALLRGPAHAGEVLVHGGLFVLDDGDYVVLHPAG